MFELTFEEQRSFQIVYLECKVQKQLQTGFSFKWKKVSLSRAMYKSQRLQVKNMTQGAAAAFKSLQEHNCDYKYFLDRQTALLGSNSNS